MANIFEDILTKLKSLSTNETSSSDNGPYVPSSYSTKSNIKTDTVSNVATTPLKVENTPVVETKTPKLTNTSVLSNASTTVKNSTPTVKTYADFGNDNDYERYLVENKINKSTGDALAYMQQKAKENNTTTRDYAISMTKRVKNTLNAEKLEANKDSLTDTQKEGLNQFGVLVDSNGNETDVNTYNNNVNLYKETADNINNQIQELNNAYTSGQIDYATMQSKYNELQSKWNENQLVGEDLSTYKSLSGFDYYDWAKANGKDVSEFEKYAESLDDSWIENIAEVYAASVADAINTPVQIYDILKNIVTGEDFTDSNTLSTQLNDAANELRTYAYAGTDGAKKWSTQLIDSLLPMVHSYINAYGITGLTGATQTGAALDKLVGGISTGILGAQTAGQVTRQRIEEGNDLTSSVINGVLHGAITTAVEGLDAGNIASLVTGNAESYLLSSAMLSKANPIKIAGYLNSIGASEGAEEIIESLADTLADKVQNSITDALDGTTLKKVNESELNVSDMANEFVMAYAGAVLMGLPTAVSVSLNSKAKYNAAESAKAYFQSTLDSEIATIEEKDLAYRAIEKINYDEQNSSYKKNNQIGDAITLSTDYVPTTQTYDDAMNNLTNAVQSDIQGELKTATDTLTKAKEMQNLFQNSLNERGINMTSEDYLNLTNEAKDNVKKVTRYADSLGTDVEWKNLTAKDGSVIDGVYENGHIVLNPNGKETALSTLVHEYTHGNESSKYYDTSRNLIKDYLGEEEFSKQKEDVKKNYSTITNLTDEQAEREVVAKTTQKLLGNEDFVERLVKYNNSLAFELWTDIKHLVGLNDNINEIEYNFEKAFADKTSSNPELASEYSKGMVTTNEEYDNAIKSGNVGDYKDIRYSYNTESDPFMDQDINDLFKDFEKKEVQRAKLEEEARKIDEAMMNDSLGDNEANRKMFKKIRDEQGAAQNNATMDTLNAAEQSRINAEESLTMDEMQTIAEEAASASMSEEAMKSLNDYATEKHKEPRVLSEPSTKKTETKTMKEALFNLKQKLVDKGMAIREISRKAKNDNLEAKYDYYLNANNIANRILTEGIDKSTITQEEGKIKVNKGDKIKSLRELSSMISESEKADFDLYMYHYLNLDTSDSKINKPVFKGTTIQESQEYIDNAEKLHPEWKTVAEGYWKNTEELLNYLVEHGRLSEQTAKEWREMYPHYVPVMRADPQITETVEEGLPTAEKVKSTNQGAIQERTGGDSALEPLDYAMENYTRRVVKSALLNDFANEYRNYVKDADALFQEVEYSGDTMEMLGQEITKADDNSPATMISYTNGEMRIFEIPQAIYDALDYAQTPFKLPDSKVLTKLNSIRRNLITGKNPIFMITNPIKDAQDVIYNSKHALKTYANMPKAFWQLLTNGDVAQIFKANGGEYSTFTYEDINKSGSDFYNNTVGRIERANSIMEMTPRLAEFMASIESGRTIDQAMYDAAEVTTNFKRGGDYTKWADRNGATFLNASVQGFDKQVRMIEDAYDQKGWKGVLSHMAKSTLLYSLPLMVVNALRWKDDEDYEQLSDYVKENYYILFKYGDGQFFRIPKGRVAAAYQSVLDTLYENGEEIVGDDELTEKAKNIWENTLDGIKTAYDNVGVNNPLSNNIFAPIVQVANNESWYGDPIVSDYMAKKANSEQYDYSTDSFSVWLGKQTDISPKKINYLLDQYSGGLGDLVLPVLTPKAETGLSDGTVAGNVAGALISPLADKFTTDSVFKNQNVTDFYTLADELYSKASKENAADEVILSNKYINSIKSKMNELYSERNDIYNDTEMSDSEKYEKAKEVQKQVVELAQSGLATYDQIDMYENYAEINGVGFTKDEDGWRKASTETVDFINDLDIDNKVELKSKVLGATGVSENGKTVRNSKALEVADAYADAGVLDDVFKYIEENGIEPSDVGLTKTVAEKSYDEIAAMYEDIYGEVFGNEESKAEGIPTASINTGKTSTKKSTSKEETKIKNALNRYASALTGGTTNYYSGANTKQTTLDDVDKNVEAILKKYKV